MDDTTRKLENIDERQRQLELLNVKISSMLERHDESLNNHDERISHLEERKVLFLDKLAYIVLAAISGGVVTAIISTVLK